MARQQKCTDPTRFCDVCNGFGYVVRGFGTDIAAVRAMIDAGLGDRPIETAEVECSTCRGTGLRRPQKRLFTEAS